jgi:hypothetical protein
LALDCRLHHTRGWIGFFNRWKVMSCAASVTATLDNMVSITCFQQAADPLSGNLRGGLRRELFGQRHWLAFGDASRQR